MPFGIGNTYLPNHSLYHTFSHYSWQSNSCWTLEWMCLGITVGKISTRQLRLEIQGYSQDIFIKTDQA